MSLLSLLVLSLSLSEAPMSNGFRFSRWLLNIFHRFVKMSIVYELEWQRSCSIVDFILILLKAVWKYYFFTLLVSICHICVYDSHWWWWKPVSDSKPLLWHLTKIKSTCKVSEAFACDLVKWKEIYFCIDLAIFL